jgi:hypothetical protein
MRLALADVRGRIGRLAALHDAGHFIGARRVDEPSELVEMLIDELVVVRRERCTRRG